MNEISSKDFPRHGEVFYFYGQALITKQIKLSVSLTILIFLDKILRLPLFVFASNYFIVMASVNDDKIIKI
jgi:hypothetical protein